ncbi:MAG: hypothetical protein MZV64_27430 [Ignavibacteriales bacterium]|nr:hypothetical protein [Ignavibacteriales bacterium]
MKWTLKNTANLPDGVGKKIIEALKKQSEQPVKNAQIEQQPQFDDFMTSHEEFSYDEGNDAYNYEKNSRNSFVERK